MTKKLVNQATSTPTRKIMAVGIGALLSVIVVYVIDLIIAYPIPVIVPSLFVAAVSFTSGYVVREAVTVL